MRSLLVTFMSLVAISASAIVGGELVSESDPVAASTLGLSNGCTGTLIDVDLVLTAAHCLTRTQGLQIVFGTSFGDSERIPAKSFVRHPNYSGGGGTHPDLPAQNPVHDIGLVKMAQPAPAGYAPVELHDGRDLETGDPLILAGFGQSNPVSGGGFGRLRKVETVFNYFNDKALEIVFGPTPGKSACRGDSGGPMYIEENGELKVIGATSRGFSALGPCSGNGNYSDVASHFDWIEEEAEKL